MEILIERLTQRLILYPHRSVVYCYKISLAIQMTRSKSMMYELTMYELFYISYQQLWDHLISEFRITAYPYNKCIILQSRDCDNPLSWVTPIVTAESISFNSPDDLSHLPFLLKFFATITVALAIRREPVGLLPGTPRPPDAVYVRILVPFATRLMFNSKLCFGAVIRAFALEAIALCSRCIRLLRLFRVGARSGTGTARGARVAALSSQAIFYFTNYI